VLKKRSRSDQDDYELYSQRKNKHSKKKRKKRKHGKDVEIDGEVIDGLETVDTYNPGNEDEANVTSNKQDNMILKQLFKRSGVDTVIHHDKVISGGDPDALIVESEADKIAQSAAKALKESCRQCHSDSGGSTRGQITWTGAHGTIGAPRFGDVVSSVGDDKVCHVTVM
jgi:DNA excision repair protein ERCC-6